MQCRRRAYREGGMAQQVRQMNGSDDRALYRQIKASSKDVRLQPTLQGDLGGGISPLSSLEID
jgi:hypothetical protein